MLLSILFFLIHLIGVLAIVFASKWITRLNLKWFNAMGFIGKYAFVWGCIALIKSHTLLEVLWVAAVVLYGCTKAYGWSVVKDNIGKSIIAAKTKALEIWANRQ